MRLVKDLVSEGRRGDGELIPRVMDQLGLADERC